MLSSWVSVILLSWVSVNLHGIAVSLSPRLLRAFPCRPMVKWPVYNSMEIFISHVGYKNGPPWDGKPSVVMSIYTLAWQYVAPSVSKARGSGPCCPPVTSRLSDPGMIQDFNKRRFLGVVPKDSGHTADDYIWTGLLRQIYDESMLVNKNFQHGIW